MTMAVMMTMTTARWVQLQQATYDAAHVFDYWYYVLPRMLRAARRVTRRWAGDYGGVCAYDDARDESHHSTTTHRQVARRKIARKLVARWMVGRRMVLRKTVARRKVARMKVAHMKAAHMKVGRRSIPDNKPWRSLSAG
ncbi:hypothetical protein AGABI2DRAFT_116996 [Agaricus bisporus var. bisporus H97]|uniref:hypothetical protein n=1 Tax=Agaricus bisporus var. bisporus (strain H97 / ATCC MYA-4626 / FGSC 10389) TaxID=936046 RepID=UPI00029F5381|nr:hypothetical protein AGABI2DRAFT_116996 [Agaricus bisporus var. bisporus H97]EKV48171.1 hypothetical protein AGABI2DRAFT_116996 [Agaricus bisporus var. bisporus H97]